MKAPQPAACCNSRTQAKVKVPWLRENMLSRVNNPISANPIPRISSLRSGEIRCQKFGCMFGTRLGWRALDELPFWFERLLLLVRVLLPRRAMLVRRVVVLLLAVLFLAGVIYK